MTSVQFGEIDRIPGWAAFAKTYINYVENRARDGDFVVEIGVGFGKSAAFLARKLIEKGVKVELFVVDPWLCGEHWMPPKLAELGMQCGGPFCAFAAAMLQVAPDALELVKPLRLHSKNAVPIFADHSLAMVMIDGDHSYEGCKQDIQDWMVKVAPDGILAGDDYHVHDFPGVVRAVNEVIGDGNYTVDGTTWIAKPEWIAKVAGGIAYPPGLHAAAAGSAPSKSALAIEPEPKPQPANDLSGWRFVESTGGAKWVGKAVSRHDGEVTLRPALECSPATIFVPTPVPGNGYGMQTVSLAECWPPMHMDSCDHEVTVRYASLSADLSTYPEHVQHQARAMITKGRKSPPAQEFGR